MAPNVTKWENVTKTDQPSSLLVGESKETRWDIVRAGPCGRFDQLVPGPNWSKRQSDSGYGFITWPKIGYPSCSHVLSEVSEPSSALTLDLHSKFGVFSPFGVVWTGFGHGLSEVTKRVCDYIGLSTNENAGKHTLGD